MSDNQGSSDFRDSRRSIATILVIGQTPPPVHGQALMTERLVQHSFKKIEILHIRMNFSKSIDEVGRFAISKVGHLFSIILKTWKARLLNRQLVLYYMPNGTSLVPLLRDIAILTAIRPFFRKTVFHFRSAGVCEYVRHRSLPLRALALLVHYRPSGSISLSAYNPPDGEYFSSRRCRIIPNGLPDNAEARTRDPGPHIVPRISYLGTICKEKGVLDLLDAARLLCERGCDFELQLTGQFDSEAFRDEASARLERRADLAARVTFNGVLVDREKHAALTNSDIFCFPTFYRSEAFGNVIVEAMMNSLPVVATRWRAIGEIVLDRETGLLVDINQPGQLADALEALLKDADRRKRYGRNGRLQYEERFRPETFFRSMENMFCDVAES